MFVGDVLRRLVARSRAGFGQQFQGSHRTTNTPLTTRAGCESIAHVLQGLTDLDPQATVLSVGGVGAFDLISRAAMLTALRDAPGCDPGRLRCISGKMTLGKSMKSCREKEVNKETR